MMEGSDNLVPRLSQCLLLFLFVLVRSSSCAQEGFVSIRCCDELNFTDPDTTINWTPDERWFPDRTGCRNITRPAENYNGYDQARTFSLDSGKICYNLTTSKDQDYLIRGSFLFGDTLGASFDVSIGTTTISSVISARDLIVEGIFRATGDEIDFCLVKGKGNPYISELELRPLNDTDYLNGQSSSVLKVVRRINVGGSDADIRYPDDPNDRIWEPPSSLVPIPSSVSNISIQIPSQTVPSRVLQTALTRPERLHFPHLDLDTRDNNYTVFLYFLELNGSVSIGQRVFDIYINNVKKIPNFDILDAGSKYKKVALNATANGSLNLTLIKVTNGSEYGPILNAYEILQVQERAQETNEEDVKVMKEVKDELLLSNKDNEKLESWSGDPCCPVSWEGLACELYDGYVVINRLDLSSRNLVGIIPPSVTKLTYLNKLNLSNNGFVGNIPPFPATSILNSVDLSHNNLTGRLPESLTFLKHLSTLYYGCNPNFTKEEHRLDSLKITTDNGACGGQGSKITHSVHGILIGTVVCASFLFTVAVGILAVCFHRRKLRDRTTFNPKAYPITKNAVFSISSMDDVLIKSICIETFTLDYIAHITQKYKTLIGEGGFGSVYRGTLHDGEEVAVKVRSATSTQGTREFNNELDLLSAIRHENLVRLLGYCSENDQQILVYPFMSNGSLQDRLYGEAAKKKKVPTATLR